MKKIYTLLLVAVFGVSGLVAQTYSGGDGSEATPFLISNVQDLLELDTAKTQWASANHYRLTTDLDMKGQTFTPIGYEASSGLHVFRGTFDGGNHVIKNLTISDPADNSNAGKHLGFVGYGEQNTIKNLGLDSLTVNATGNMGGAIMSRGRWGCYITNCFVINSVVEGVGYIGGIVGFADGVHLTNVLSEVEVGGNWRNAGIYGNIVNRPQIAKAVMNYRPTVSDSPAIVGGYVPAEGGSMDWEDVYYITNVPTNVGDTIGVELSRNQLTKQSSYGGISFDTAWVMKADGFAVLKSFPISAFEHLEGIIPPVANAGEDKTIFGKVVDSLNAKGSTYSYDTILYSWTSLDGIDLDDTTKAKPIFTAPDVAGETTYKFKLVVYDSAYGVIGKIMSAPDTVAITVKKAAVAAKLDPATWTATALHTGGDNTVEEVFDGDLETTWYSDWKLVSAAFPIWYMIDLNKTAEIDQFIYYSRQDAYGPNGTVAGYELYISDDKNDFGTAVASGTFDWPTPVYGADGKATNKDDYKTPQSVELAATATGRYIKFVATSQIGNIAPNASPPQMGIAELWLYGLYVNTPPSADAGSDQTVQVGELVTLDGSKSEDIDKETISYTWTMDQAATDAGIALSDANISKPTFTAPNVDAAADYVFTLVVDDGTVSSNPSTTTVTVDPDLTSIANTNAVDVSVYPNPSNGMFTIESASAIEVNVKDILGRTIKAENFNGGVHSLDLTSFGKGLYILNVKEGNKVSTLKLRTN